MCHGSSPVLVVRRWRVDVAERAVRGPLGGEDLGMDRRVDGRDPDLRRVRRDDRDQVVLGRAAGERLEVVGTVDRGAVVAVVRAGDDDRPDLRLAEAASSAATRSTDRLGCVLESNRSPATRNRSTLSSIARSTAALNAALALTLGCRGFSEVGVTSAEMDVRGVEQSEHPVAAGLLSVVTREATRRGGAEAPATCSRRPSAAPNWRERAPLRPRSPPRFSQAIVTGRVSRSPVAARRWSRPLWPFRQIPLGVSIGQRLGGIRAGSRSRWPSAATSWPRNRSGTGLPRRTLVGRNLPRIDSDGGLRIGPGPATPVFSMGVSCPARKPVRPRSRDSTSAPG